MTSSDISTLTSGIREFGYSLGFDLIGIALVKELSLQKAVFYDWLEKGMNADMAFLSKNVGKRTNPELLLEGAKSVLVAAINYKPTEIQGGKEMPIISKYVYGDDYHVVIGDKLKKLLEYIIACKPGTKGSVCVDSSPILEKTWAREAGLGWIGKNSILINRELGSFIFLGEIVLDIELEYDEPFTDDFCGNCRLCVISCPTQAINRNKTIDARKCISWMTFENKKAIPEEFRGLTGGRIIGCDACQDVCPWNRNSPPHRIPEFDLSELLKSKTKDEWLSLSRAEFDSIFAGSSVKRMTYTRLLRNITFSFPEFYSKPDSK